MIENGRRVKNFENGFGEEREYYNFSNKPDLVATIINEYHGAYDENWLVIEQNGKEVKRVGVNQYCSIEWWPDEGKEAEDGRK